LQHFLDCGNLQKNKKKKDEKNPTRVVLPVPRGIPDKIDEEEPVKPVKSFVDLINNRPAPEGYCWFWSDVYGIALIAPEGWKILEAVDALHIYKGDMNRNGKYETGFSLYCYKQKKDAVEQPERFLGNMMRKWKDNEELQLKSPTWVEEAGIKSFDVEATRDRFKSYSIQLYDADDFRHWHKVILDNQLKDVWYIIFQTKNTDWDDYQVLRGRVLTSITIQ